jgi:hypothetical protein
VNQQRICINFCLKAEGSENYKIYQKQFKSKEDRVLKLCEKKFGKPTLYDKVIDGNCSKARPDIVYDMETHVVIIEVDENQHKNSNYCREGEYFRMISIFNSYGGTPVIFIRYNPDSYKDIKGEKDKIDNIKREEILLKWIEKARDNIPKSLCNIIYLFYDGYNKKIKEFFPIDPYDTKIYKCSENNCKSEQTYIRAIYENHICYF